MLDLTTRFFQQVAIGWITEVSAGYDLDFAQIRSVGYFGTLLYMSTSLAWAVSPSVLSSVSFWSFGS